MAVYVFAGYTHEQRPWQHRRRGVRDIGDDNFVVAN